MTFGFLQLGLALRSTRLAVLLAAFALLFADSVGLRAQTVLPSQVTPKTFAPRPVQRPVVFEITSAAALQAPKGAEKVSITLSRVVVEGGFADLSGANQAAMAAIAGKRLSLAQIFAAAADLERAYAAAGYFLVRVSLPPQKLVEGGALKIAVVDGFIESIDSEDVPQRVRKVVAKRTERLIGRKRLLYKTVERATLLAGDAPGLVMRSVLLRGKADGGVILKLSGEHRLAEGSTGYDNRLSQRLGTQQLNGRVTLNSALGAGEILYGSLNVGIGEGLDEVFSPDDLPILVIGLGAMIPVGLDGWTINPEFTHSRSKPEPAAGQETEGTFERYALRVANPVIRSRTMTLRLTGAVEYAEQNSFSLTTGNDLSLDQYGVARLGVDLQGVTAARQTYQLIAQLSRGLGGREVEDNEEPALSHKGASPWFTKAIAEGSFMQPLPQGFQADLKAKAQFSFGDPLLSSEQLSMEGLDEVSGFEPGAINADTGAVLRGELSHPLFWTLPSGALQAQPYAFAAGGLGRLYEASAQEESNPRAHAFGAGLRMNFDAKDSVKGASVALEYARAFSNLPDESRDARLSVTGSFRF